MFNYKNPFMDYDSNIMSSEQINEFYIEPYDSYSFSKSKIVEDKSPIVIIGGRGTGKTMLLRQLSYNVQKISNINYTYLEKVKESRYIGIYFRVDKPLLQSLSELGAIYPIKNFEESIFTHFLELTIFKEYIEIVKVLENDANINVKDKIYQQILSEMLSIFPASIDNDFIDLESLLEFVIEEINYIWEFQSKKAIDIDNNVKFNPKCKIILQGRLSDEFCKTRVFNLLGINNPTLLLLIDEFESFSEKQQMVINAAMRYNKEYGIRLRIGMRPYGFKTFDTVNSEDFIKEGRDYSKIVFDNPLVKKNNNTQYFKLVKRIADRRLAYVPMFEKMSITDVLGHEEDLVSEAKAIVNGKTKHLEIYLNEINKKQNSNLSIDSLISIRNENPLLEMECLRLLLHGKDLQYVEKALSDYMQKANTPEAVKFSNDYDNKYKLSFVFVLCSIYKKEKKDYYSFNDFCYLSSGIIGSFIELCRRAFDLAYFRDYQSLQSGKISKEVQTDAAYDYSNAEYSMISRIFDGGKNLEVFINNIGNAFSCIHKDIFLRYPETNMFPITLELSDENKKLIEIACKWSLIFKKSNKQRAPGKKSNDIYILSRVFSPYFNISYRTRGGLNPIKTITDDYFSTDFNPKDILKKHKSDSNGYSEIQMSFFDLKKGT